jgi:hypothetical protein
MLSQVKHGMEWREMADMPGDVRKLIFACDVERCSKRGKRLGARNAAMACRHADGRARPDAGGARHA